MMMHFRHITLAFLLLAVACVGSRTKRAEAPVTRSFPSVSIPSAYTSEADRLTYMCEHFWDGYLSGSGVTDSAHVLGVLRSEVEQNMANYISILWMQQLPEAQKNVADLFVKVSRTQQRDSTSHFYTQFSQIVSSYLYDPNSPMRDEDLYLPYVQGLAESPLTREDMRTAYRYEASCCRIAHRGGIAPDIRASRPDGSRFTLHGIMAPYTLLFFTNPGCHACKEIIDQINSELGAAVESGDLAVANIYIDEDYAAWKDYVINYPSKWYTGFNYDREVREERTYDVRAIPSIYLLDSSKRILLKDAPFERVLSVLRSAGAQSMQ